MADELTNLVLSHLREFRSAMDAKLAAIEQRLDRMETNGLKMMRSFVGHRSMVVRTVADHEEDISDLKLRVRRLEETRG
jgi:hypothetical protein